LTEIGFLSGKKLRKSLLFATISFIPLSGQGTRNYKITILLYYSSYDVKYEINEKPDKILIFFLADDKNSKYSVRYLFFTYRIANLLT